MIIRDDLGDLLRQFYQTYGRQEEGPPAGLNLSVIIPQTDSIQRESDMIKQLLSNSTVQRDFERCRDILEHIATSLSETHALLQELKNLNLKAEGDVEHFTNGIFLFTLASQLHPNAETKSEDLSLPEQIPEPFRRSLQVQGALVFKLYIGLVYMRGGILNGILSESAAMRMPNLGLFRKLLNCDYVRHIRNALSHADFSPCMVGISFRDNGYMCIASPGFLDWLCIWLFTLYHSCVCVLEKD
jgi:hypothetical protein